MSTSGLPTVRASKLIHIRSENRSSGSNTSFRVNLKSPIILNSLNESIFLSLTSAIIPHTFYNVNNGNNEFSLQFQKRSDSSFVAKNYTIPPGFYTDSLFKDKIQTTLNDSMNLPAGESGTPFVVNKDDTTNKFSITYSSTVYRINKMNYIDDMFKIFGFQSNKTVDQNANVVDLDIKPTYDNNTLTSTTKSYLQMCNGTSPVNISQVNELRLVVNNLNTNEVYNNYFENNELILSNILINFPPNSFIYHYPHYRNSVKINDTVIQYLDISLEDTNGNVIDLNNVPWSCVIRVDFRTDKERQHNEKLNFLK